MYTVRAIGFRDMSPQCRRESEGSTSSGGPVRAPLHVRLLCTSAVALADVRLTVNFVADVASARIVVPLATTAAAESDGGDADCPWLSSTSISAAVVASEGAVAESLLASPSPAAAGPGAWPAGTCVLVEVRCPRAAEALERIREKYLWHVGMLQLLVHHSGSAQAAEVNVICQMRKEASPASRETTMTRTFLDPAH